MKASIHLLIGMHNQPLAICKLPTLISQILYSKIKRVNSNNVLIYMQHAQ